MTFLYRPLTEKVNVELLNDFFDTFHIVNDCNKNGNFITERVEPTEERKKKLKEEIESLVKYNDLLISFNMETYNEYTVFFFLLPFAVDDATMKRTLVNVDDWNKITSHQKHFDG